MDKGLLFLLTGIPLVLSAQTYEELIATPDLSRRPPQVQAPASPTPEENPVPAQGAPAEVFREVIIEQPTIVEQIVNLTNYITNYVTNAPLQPPPVLLDNTTTVNVSNTVIQNVYTLQPLSPDIFTAVFFGRLTDVRIFIERRVYGPNAVYNDGNSLLHLAVYHPQGLTSAVYLIEQGANLNATNRLGQTPLHVAVLRTNLPAVELLVNSRASLAAKDAAGQTAIWLANITGQTDMLKILAAAYQSREGAVVSEEPLKAKGLPNVPSPFDLFNGRSRSLAPISTNLWHQALYRPGIKETVSLIQQSYNPRDTDSKGQNALHIAAFYDNAEAARYLLSQGVPVNAPDNFGDTPLHIAAGRSSPELVKLLVDYGAGVLDKNKSGWTPLFEAVLLGNVPAAEYLLQKGVSPNTRTATGRTPVHEAARLGSLDMLIALLDKGAVLNPADKDGKTPLYLASEAGNIQAVAQLVSRGSPVDTETKEGLTPLHIAVRNGHTGLVQYLVEVGNADILIPDSKGRYPLETAYVKGNDALIAYLASQYTAAQAKGAVAAPPLALPAQTPAPQPAAEMPPLVAPPPADVPPAPNTDAYEDPAGYEDYPPYDEEIPADYPEDAEYLPEE